MMSDPVRLVLSRRLLLAGAAALALAACSGEGDKKAEAPAEKAAEAPAATPAATPATPAADVKVREASGSVDVAKLMEAGALPEMVLGSADAPVTIVEYASMTCGHCAAFHAGTYKTLKKDFIDTGKVRFVFREFPFDPLAEAAFMLARCSGDRYFPMVDALFASQTAWARAEKPSEALFQISKQAGFTQDQFNACLSDGEMLAKIRTVRERGSNDFGVEATPTFFINGKRYSGNMPPEEMAALINAAM